MRAIILAAGYGTRMRGVIGDAPKALVEVGGRSILDHLLANLAVCCDESDVVLVSNARYLHHFIRWKEECGSRVTVLDDGSTEAGNRRGAVGDIRFAIEQTGLADDVLIVAADNVFVFDFGPLIKAFKQNADAAHVGVWYNPDLEDQKRRGVVKLDDAGRLTGFAEKPEHPESHWAAAPLYLLPRQLIYTVREFIADGGNIDAPGYFVEYLVGRHVVSSWRMPGEIFDVGNPESLVRAKALLGSGGVVWKS